MVELREGSALLHLMRSSVTHAARPTTVVDPEPPEHGEEEVTITCGFCGREFVEDRGQATCQACPLHKACGLVRCPHCGYENPRQPAWLTRIKEWMR